MSNENEIHSKFCDGKYFEFIEYGFSVFFLIAVMIPYIVGCIWFCKNSRKVNKTFSYSFYANGFLYIIFVISSAFAVYSCDNIADDIQRIFRIIGIWGYVFEIGLSLLVVGWRLRVSFTSSHIQLNIKLIKKCEYCMILFFVTACCGIALATWFSEKNDVLYLIGSLSLTFAYILYLVIFFIVLKTFVNTLMQLVIQRQKQKYHEFDTFESVEVTNTTTDRSIIPAVSPTSQRAIFENGNKLDVIGKEPTHPTELSNNSRQLVRVNTAQRKHLNMDKIEKRFVTLATKYFTLAFVVFITTLFGIITSAFQSRIKTYLVTNLVNFAIFIDGYLNFLCLFLQYQFSNKTYKICCGIFDKCLFKILKHKVDISLKKEIELTRQMTNNVVINDANNSATNENTNSAYDSPGNNQI